MTNQASSLLSLLWTLLYVCWTIDSHLLQTISHVLLGELRVVAVAFAFAVGHVDAI